jgi:hypothetical protein
MENPKNKTSGRKHWDKAEPFLTLPFHLSLIFQMAALPFAKHLFLPLTS